MIFGGILKEELTTIKKWVERMTACLTANRQYFEEENFDGTVSESEDYMSE